jgi:hypothetical protein
MTISTTAETLLDSEAAAARACLSEHTWLAYTKPRGRGPRHDGWITEGKGRPRRGWLPATVDTWRETHNRQVGRPRGDQCSARTQHSSSAAPTGVIGGGFCRKALPCKDHP